MSNRNINQINSIGTVVGVTRALQVNNGCKSGLVGTGTAQVRVSPHSLVVVKVGNAARTNKLMRLAGEREKVNEQTYKIQYFSRKQKRNLLKNK